MKKPKVVAVVGPTAVGKTALSVGICRAFNGEVVSCDSMQVYRGMDIGTAKVTREEAKGIRHRMIDICDVGESFSCADYAFRAKAETDDIISHGKLPVFCGGTGLYLDSVLTGNSFSEAGASDELRAELSKKSEDELWNYLYEIDRESAEATHKNNKKRVIRAIETYKLTGKTKTEWDRLSRREQKPYDSLIIGLRCSDRERLYDRINARVDEMMSRGLVDEVKSLGLEHGSCAGAAIGYKEIIAYLEGKCTLDSAVEEIKKASRNYAKRQMTWFSRNKDILWYDTDLLSQSEIRERAISALEKFLKD